MTGEPKCLVVRLEADLEPHRVSGLFHAIALHPGVQDVTDLSAISQTTLDGMLRKPEPVQPKKRRGKKSA